MNKAYISFYTSPACHNGSHCVTGNFMNGKTFKTNLHFQNILLEPKIAVVAIVFEFSFSK